MCTQGALHSGTACKVRCMERHGSAVQQIHGPGLGVFFLRLLICHSRSIIGPAPRAVANTGRGGTQ